MSITFYNNTGEAIAYTSDETNIYLFSGKPVGYITNDAVYAFSGSHLGWFINGWIIDQDGDCVFFTYDAKGGPMKPMKQIKPVKSVKHIKPMKAMKKRRHPMKRPSTNWSKYSNEDYFDR